MTEFDIIRDEINTIEQKYLISAMDIISDYKNENKTKIDYKRRQIYELLQNADDCYSKDFPTISVHIELRGNILIVQNTGVPFSARGIASLMHTDASSKYEGTIGCKGLGFRAVLNWANRITVYTNDFYVDFSEERAIKKLEFYKQQTHANFSDELVKLDRTAILTAAEVYDDQIEIKKWLASEYSTAIVLYCNDEYVEEIKNQLIHLKFEELLFLKHINTIEIVTSNGIRKIESIKDDGLCIIQEADSISEWQIWCRNGEITEQNGNAKKYELIIAYNKDESQREIIRENGFLYSFFRTDIPMHFPFLIHGTFDLTSERNSLVKDNLSNNLILEKLVDFIGEIGEGLVKIDGNSDYEALKFLLPSEPMGQLDQEYNFTKKLRNKIKEYKVFPTINNEYISVSESPKYSSRGFDELLLPSTCYTLLKRTTDRFISEYINDIGIRFYTDKELVELINQDAQHYIDMGINSELIALYYETFIGSVYPRSHIAPKLMTDSKGKHIIDDSVKIFNTPTQQFDLPEWSQMYFINPKLEESLSKRLQMQGRNDLPNKLKTFGTVEYSFGRVLGELISQSKDNLQRTKEIIAWLYTYWEQNNHLFPNGLGNAEIRLISRKNEIVGVSKCYIGKEYGNEFGERLTSYYDNALYLGSPEQIGLENKNIDDVNSFLKSLGVKKYPTIETAKLSNSERGTYIEYNSLKYDQICDARREFRTHNDFFSQYEKEIWVSYVQSADKIVAQANFYDIVCWLLMDQELYNCVTNENEICEYSVMKGKPYRYKEFCEVRKSYMRSWLRKIFTEIEWLPTLGGRKVNTFNCTLLAHKLSPIVEVLDVDYDQLIIRSGKSRKEIDLLFEKLGIAEDIGDLSPQKIYEILMGLYTNKTDPNITKSIYTKLNLKFKSEMVDGLIANNPMYAKFKSEGGVLARQNGEYAYLPIQDVYYVDKKIYSEDILKNYPLLVLGKRAGAPKIQKMFGVQPIQATSDIQVVFEEHSLNMVYQKEFQRMLPYIYAKRIAVDSKNKELNALRTTKIILVNNATASYKIGDQEQNGTLQDYELIYKDKVAYIQVPISIHNLTELKESSRFRSAVAEVITTILDVDGDKDSFVLILSCKSTKEVEEHFIDSGDDDLSTVNLAKSKFSEQIDKKEEFWKAIANACGVDEVRSEQYTELMDDFNYGDLNCFENCARIITLFKQIGINIDQYNQYAFDLIDLQEYYKQELRSQKQFYRAKYFIYLLNKAGHITTKQDFDTEKQRYDEIILTAPNSVDAQLEKIYENTFGVSWNELDAMDGDVAALIAILPDALHDAPAQDIQNIQIKPTDHIIDYISIDAQIAAETNGESKRVELSALQSHNFKADGVQKHGRTYEATTTQAKEENGYKAESKVYHTLCSRIGEKGTVAWVSGNGYHANANTVGDDSLGYDIWYSDEAGKKHYVEVKGSTSENIEFTLTRNEFDFAEQHLDEYEIWYVKIVDKKATEPYELGNLLLLNEEESFFKNSKFSVENSEFKIRARVCEITK